MNHQTQALQVEPIGGDGTVLGQGGGYAHDQPANPIQVIHRLLEGRYLYALVLGLLGAVVCGTLGYMIPKPLYRSTGAIRFRPVVQRVLYESEESGVMPMFGAFVGEQAELIQRQRVLDMAMTDDAWTRLGRKTTPDEQEEFRESLEVRHGGQSTIVTVSFLDHDPQVPQVAVKAVIDAYMRIFGDHDVAGEAERFRILEQRRAALTGQISSLRQRILSIANEFGSDALEQMYVFKVEQLNQVETKLVDMGMALAAAGVSAAVEGAPVPLGVAEMTIEQIADHDQRMRKLIEQSDRAMETYQLMSFRYGENHQRARRAKEDWTVAEVLVNRYADVIRSGKVTIGRANNRGSDKGLSVVELRERQKHLQDLYDRTKAEMLDLGRKKLQIDNLRVEMDTVQQRLEDTKFRIEQLGLESATSGRIDVVSRGDRPTGPDKDRRIPISIAGACAGGSLGVGAVLLVGVFGTRLRNSDDARTAASNIRLLGVLPNLPNDLTDPEQIAIAGYSVHHIRTLLQLRPDVSGPQVFSVTGSAAETGKTSLTLALGISFATSGAKTLLVDFDMAGGGLTARLEAILRRRAGAILQESGLITKDQLEGALRTADSKRLRLSAALVEMGVLTEEQLNGSLAIRESAAKGVLDVLGGADVADYIVDTGIEGLKILPVGGARAHDMSRVSPASVGRMVDQARREYDIILIDTGPIPGSVEAPIVATRSDGVVLVASQGDRRPQVESAFDLLYSIGAHVEGLVYNRARTRDIARSSYSSSLSLSVGVGSRSSMHPVDAYEEMWSNPSNSIQEACYGPVARAVITSGQPVECDEQ